ncbi:GrpB family protein [Curtobacterium sp. 9128]|uniref:GrpB family protein n=1 Tax=Curtobacterium sp. 9128 TaxID=1793722 RepID=UPI00119EB0AF|nr:GrpB family protein [Curtobacterium sp. 9128]
MDIADSPIDDAAGSTRDDAAGSARDDSVDVVRRRPRRSESAASPGELTDRTRRRPDVTTVDVIGGPEAITVPLREADPAWPERYREHEARIRGVLPEPRVGVEHIGSTAVPGLAAKPIIDVLVTVDDVTAEEEYLDQLLAAGYGLRVREPGHRLVRTPERDVHVHVYEHDAPAVDAYRVLRDHLRTDEDDRVLYEETKRALLAQQWDDMNDYADAKTEVITAILARARAAQDR